MYFIEDNVDRIELVVFVVDGKVVFEIIECWEKCGEIFIDVEFY